MRSTASIHRVIRLLHYTAIAGLVSGCTILASGTAMGQTIALAEAGPANADSLHVHAARAEGTQQPAAVSPVAPSPVVTPELRADTLMARGMYQEAIAAYRRIQPRTAAIENKIGVAYQHLALDDAAVSYYQQAMATDRRMAAPYNNLGTIYFQEKENRLAKQLYKKSIRLDGSKAAFWGNLAMVYLAQKQYSDCAEAFQRAFKLDPDIFQDIEQNGLRQGESPQDLARMYLTFAEIYAHAGMRAEAIVYIRKALDEGFRSRQMIEQDQQLAVLHGYPAFEQLLNPHLH